MKNLLTNMRQDPNFFLIHFGIILVCLVVILVNLVNYNNLIKSTFETPTEQTEPAPEPASYIPVII